MSEATGNQSDVATEVAVCEHCRKPGPLCICDTIEPIDNRIEVLILQHPQEQDRALGSARVAALGLSRAQVRVGLSWSSLGKLLGRDVDPQRWAILYLGSARAAELAPENEIVVLDRTGEAAAGQAGILRAIDGIIVLDGTWSQAKALWWRNPWMLKCRRVILGPRQASRYGKLRREPRQDGLATIEAVALLLAKLERKPEIETQLTQTFERMLAQYRAAIAADPSLAPRPKRRRWRK